ncbi:MAG: hypothetical protein ROR55_17465 [Devosia sp.]
MTDTTTEERQEAQSKDAYFERIAALSHDMVKAHGKDFAMGAFVLAARWIAEGKADRPVS